MATKQPQKKSSKSGKGSRKAEERSLWDIFIHTKFRWWNIFTVGLIVFFIWAVTYEEPETVWEEPRCPYENYKGYDPTREVTEIASVDYENRTVTYRPKRNESYGAAPYQSVFSSEANSGGTVIYDNNGKAHSIDATPEEIVEQLRHEIDFDDLADQADYWPDDE